VSPLFDRGLGDVPSTLIVTAACDPLRDDGERHAKGLRRADATVELRRYDGMIHGFFQMTGALERSRRLHRELGEWMREAADEAQRVTVGDALTGA
jgi:acetyl esterase